MRAAVELIVRDELIAAPHTSLNGPIERAPRDFAAVRFDLADIKAIKNGSAGRSTTSCWRSAPAALRHLLLARGEELPAGACARRCR